MINRFIARGDVLLQDKSTGRVKTLPYNGISATKRCKTAVLLV